METLNNLNEYFKDGKTATFFTRISGYDKEIEGFLVKLYPLARKTGVIIDGKIQNPITSNLEYYDTIIGKEFILDITFLKNNLQKWLPRLNQTQKDTICKMIFDSLSKLKLSGKNDGILKNVYIKYMCWLYYKFEGILLNTHRNIPCFILYCGEISRYELDILWILSKCGCDIVLVQPNGDSNYKNLDTMNVFSKEYPKQGEFPKDFSLKTIDALCVQNQKLPTSNHVVQTNQWITGNIFEDILKPIANRGENKDFHYNCFLKMTGVEDKVHFKKELHAFLTKLSCKTLVLETNITPITPNETNKINIQNYKDAISLISSLANQISYPASINVQNQLKQAFIEHFQSELNTTNLNSLKNKAVSTIALINRYKDVLFKNSKDMPVFILLDGCKNQTQKVFIECLAKCPVDILLLCPDLTKQDLCDDSLLFEKKFESSFILETFPSEQTNLNLSTIAFEAEQEINDILYSGDSLFRDFQYKNATIATLRTMREEIDILWKQPPQFRPNFNVIDNKILLPVIFAKLEGVDNPKKYWDYIGEFITEKTYVITKIPFYTTDDIVKMRSHSAKFLNQKKINRQEIFNCTDYTYAHIRDDMQHYILDKAQLLIDRNCIKMPLQSGIEYGIISTILSLNKEIVRLLQTFDFTKENPKIVMIDTTESMTSVEDSIILAFLNLIGFDILVFTPTGYKNLENHLQADVFEKHNIGNFVYDLVPPNAKNIKPRNNSWKLFRRGN